MTASAAATEDRYYRPAVINCYRPWVCYNNANRIEEGQEKCVLKHNFCHHVAFVFSRGVLGGIIMLYGVGDMAGR